MSRNSNEWVVANDEGVVDGPFYTRESAEEALLRNAEGEDDHGLTIEDAADYDEDGEYIEDGE